jgi:DNA-binding NtrC family response regulator
MRLLKKYNWPGNIRELRNVLECAGYLSEDGIIGAAELPAQISKNTEYAHAQGVPRQIQDAANFQISGIPVAPPGTAKTLAGKVKLFEKAEVLCAVAQYGGGMAGKKKAAEELNISLSSLYNKIS